MKKTSLVLLLLPAMLLLVAGAYIVATGESSAWEEVLPPSLRWTTTRRAMYPARVARGPLSAAAIEATAVPIAGSASSTAEASAAAGELATGASVSPTPGQATLQTPLAAAERAGTEHGFLLIAALESFNRDQGYYPDSLDLLIPVYLNEIPSPPQGHAYSYRLFEVGHPLEREIYWLAFRLRVAPGTICTYYRRLELWNCDPAVP
jgi:hypothetical protein